MTASVKVGSCPHSQCFCDGTGVGRGPYRRILKPHTHPDPAPLVSQATGRQEALQESLNLPSAADLGERLRQLREAGGGATAEGIAQGLEAELAGVAPPALAAELQLQRDLMLEWPLYTAQLASQVRLCAEPYPYC